MYPFNFEYGTVQIEIIDGYLCIIVLMVPVQVTWLCTVEFGYNEVDGASKITLQQANFFIEMVKYQRKNMLFMGNSKRNQFYARKSKIITISLLLQQLIKFQFDIYDLF
eukprot:TRINITY_DN2414_c0_g1_i3.p2 TRINITY_DN2414_c0_g1~~TRINITY_DN2414_c0_g1_i3.p2  ORF type:complete len:109 (+),score=0.94 TRINITY_DN2414_c0_g1_i3:356-682(+)